MKERPKLGRGLQDVSKFFLSSTTEKAPLQEGPKFQPIEIKTITVCCPGSPLIQSVFSSNLALELARHRCNTLIKDFSSCPEERVSRLMNSIISGDNNAVDKVVVKLYGLPEIIIKENIPYEILKNNDEELPEKLFGEGSAIILVNAPDTIGAFPGSLESSDGFIIISKTDEKSLLKSYAYIKMIHERSSIGRFHIVFDDSGAGTNANNIFDKFAAFINSRLGFEIHCLGCIIHDEHFERSISEERPLVLVSSLSSAKDAMVKTCSLLAENYIVQVKNS